MLQIPGWIYERMIGQAREGFPQEVCGILGGQGQVVSAIHPTTNVDASGDHFMMEPREQFAVVKALRLVELEMLAVYHSHPEIRSFKISGGKVDPEELQIIDEGKF